MPSHTTPLIFFFFCYRAGGGRKNHQIRSVMPCVLYRGGTREHAVEGPSNREGEPVKCVKVRGYAADDDDDDHDHDDDDSK